MLAGWAKLGRSAQRTPPDDGRLWAGGDPPPRAGNALEVLIEGAAYFPALEQAIRCARRSVLIAGWCITPGFALLRDEPPVLLRELLGEAAESVDVRVLLWAGAPAPVFAPRRGAVREGAMSSCAGRGSRRRWTRTSARCTATTRSWL
jgi:phosphatidylserine/phosphatidylglycerophosphate/cardiolipin synthase-like enzyme